jgi:hypothetical protein
VRWDVGLYDVWKMTLRRRVNAAIREGIIDVILRVYDVEERRGEESNT